MQLLEYGQDYLKMNNLVIPEGYFEIDIEKIEIYFHAMSHFKNAICTIIRRGEKYYFTPQFDDEKVKIYDKKITFLVTQKNIVSWSFPTSK